MQKYKFKAYSKCFNNFLDITAFECNNGEIDGIFHDGDYIGYDKEDITLIQYLGINDNDEEEIYEGFIVHVWGGEYWQGYWEFDKKYVIKDMNDIFFLGECENIKVIGNIFQNPELLEKAFNL